MLNPKILTGEKIIFANFLYENDYGDGKKITGMIRKILLSP